MTIERLTAQTAPDADRLGGKSAGLVRLLRAQLPVPEAWVIPAAVSLDPVAREACLADLVAWWDSATTEFPGSIWAVRSSAVAEDMEGASFAGVYETRLGVDSLESLQSAVEACWAAHEADRAEVYRGSNAMDAGGGIALVLQRMLQPTVAGVMLTANPQRRFADEIVIDASWGLGEAIVSGKVDPDHIVLARSTGEVRSRRISTKLTEVVYDGGLTERAVDADRQDLAALSDGDLAQLHALAGTVAENIGADRDLEWAIDGGRLYALQDRPITGLPPLQPQNVWTRGFADEYLSDYSLPLPTALMSSWMAIGQFVEMLMLQRRTDLAGQEPMLSYNGYSYMSGAYLQQVARAFPPGMRKNTFGDWFTPLWTERIMAEKWDVGAGINMLLAPFRDKGRGTIKANAQALIDHCAQIDDAIVPKLQQDYGALTMRQWREQMDELEDFGLNHFRVIRWGMGPYNAGLHQTLQDLLRKEAGDEDGELYYALISGLPGTMTAQLNFEAYDLGIEARKDAELTAALRGDGEYADIRAALPAAGFWAHFDTFMARHGHRSSSRDIAKPRWREQPEVVLGLIRAQLHTDEPPEDPRVTEARAEGRRAEAYDTAMARIGQGVGGGLRQKILRWVAEQTQIFTVYRENQRYHLDYLLAHLRHLTLEQGDRLVARGLLADRDDVFLLTGEEYWAALSDWPTTDTPIDHAGLEERRQHWLTHRDRLPATYLYDGIETEGEIVEGDPTGDEDVDGIVGLGASRGVAKGRVRVVGDLARLSEVQPGDVLVVNTIDPGWTPVFGLLAGLVTETGGILSHGAILAREYGIPTVTGVPRATQILQTGTLVEIDGNKGVIAEMREEVVA